MTAARDQRTARPEPGPGDLAAFFRAHHAFVWRSARRLGAPAEAVDDVVQDVFLAVGRGADRFVGQSSAKTWLFGITGNMVKMHLRGESRRRRRNEAAGDLVAAKPIGDTVERHAAVDMLDRMLRKLDPDQRAVFVLIELEDVDARDVARASGVSVNTVYSRLRLARHRLAAEVQRMRARAEAVP